MLDKLIGNTPLIKINYEYLGEKKSILAKLEYYNYTGSIKDRMAYYIITKSKEMGLLKNNMPIIEATSGNTGIALSAIGAYFNHDVHIFMPDWASIERVRIMKNYGAHVYLVSKEEGGFKECIRRSKELAQKLNGFLPSQFDNELNIEAHMNSTAKEIVAKYPQIEGFVSGIGTGGTLMGIGSFLKEYNKNIKVIALEPEEMALLSGNEIKGNHKIEGIGDDFIPSIVNKNLLDDIILINDDDAINMSRILAKELGLGVGISSGANFLAAVLSGISNVVTVFPDDSKKYLTTDLSKETDSNPAFISNQIKLTGLEVL